MQSSFNNCPLWCAKCQFSMSELANLLSFSVLNFGSELGRVARISGILIYGILCPDMLDTLRPMAE